MATLQPPTDNTSFKKTLEDKLASLLGAGFRSRTSRLEKKRAAWEARQQQQQQQQNGDTRQWRGTFLELSESEKGLWQASIFNSIVFCIAAFLTALSLQQVLFAAFIRA